MCGMYVPTMAGTETDRSLNRALLARQGLLEPFDAPRGRGRRGDRGAAGAGLGGAAGGAVVADAGASRPASSTPRWSARELLVGINLRATLHLVSAREHPAYHAVVEALRRDRLAAHEGAVLGRAAGGGAGVRGRRRGRARRSPRSPTRGWTSTRARSPTRSSSTSARTSGVRSCAGARSRACRRTGVDDEDADGAGRGARRHARPRTRWRP